MGNIFDIGTGNYSLGALIGGYSITDNTISTDLQSIFNQQDAARMAAFCNSNSFYRDALTHTVRAAPPEQPQRVPSKQTALNWLDGELHRVTMLGKAALA